MTLNEKITELQARHEVLAVIDLDPWHDQTEHGKKPWLRRILNEIHRDPYTDNQRIVFTVSQGDTYNSSDSRAGNLLTQLQRRLNEIDISSSNNH